MDFSIIKKAGLTDSQAKGYLALIQQGALTPAELAKVIGETRTNSYMICDKLVTLGLATKKDTGRAEYTPAHPSALESLVEKRRKIMLKNEQDIKTNLSPLIDLFYANSELPGTRTLQGLDGIKEVYRDTLRTKSDIYLLRTTKDGATLGDAFFEDYRQKRAASGITTYALTPMTEVSYQHMRSGDDEKMRYIRTPLPDNAYTAPVEIDIYGDKVAFISFGETQMATVIYSPPVAEAMRQVFRLLISKFRG